MVLTSKLEFTYIELILSQTNILNNFSSSEIQELLIQTNQKYKQKKKEQEYYGIMGLKTTALIIARILKNELSDTKMRYGEQKLNSFITSLTLTDKNLLDNISSECNRIISNGL